MSRFLQDPKTWYAIVGFLFGILVAGPVGNRMWDWPNVWPWTLIALIAACCIALWRRSEQQTQERVRQRIEAQQERDRHLAELRGEFALCRLVRDVRPVDFGFQYLEPGEKADRDRRPFYLHYVPRRISQVEHTSHSASDRIYTETDLTEELKAGGWLVILGQPIMGKSRTLYELVSALRDWVVIRPWTDRQPPSTEALQEFVTDQQVLLVIEDLNDFAAGPAPDLGALRDAILHARPTCLAIAATCRDGPELSVVGDAVDSSLRRFYDDIPLKLILLPQTNEEKGEVAASAGKAWDPAEADRYPTPGAIVMEEALRYQRSRFATLPADRQDALRSLHLLTKAGVSPLTHIRVSAVLTHVFEQTAFHLGEVLDHLAEESFLRRPARQDPIIPEPAYIEEAVVSCIEGRSVIDDFASLREALLAENDVSGLNLLGTTLSDHFGNHGTALSAIEAALRIRAKCPVSLYNKGVALALLGRLQDALDAYDAVLEVRPDDATALNNKGVVLKRLGREMDAVEAFEAALCLRPDFGEALYNKGLSLGILGRSAEAVECLSTYLLISPDDSDALYNKAVALGHLGRNVEALEVYESLLRVAPNDSDAHHNRGVVLNRLGRESEASEAFEAALRLDPTESRSESVSEH